MRQLQNLWHKKNIIMAPDFNTNVVGKEERKNLTRNGFKIIEIKNHKK